MDTLTCQQTNSPVALQQQRLPPIHMHEDAVTSPFLYIPSPSQDDGTLHSSSNASLSTHYANPSESTASCFSIGSDPKTFYSAIEFTDATLHQSLSPAISELGPLSPWSTFSAMSNETGLEESRCLIECSTNPAVRQNTSSLSKKHAHKKSKPSLSRTSSCSTGRRRSSRSSSMIRRRSKKQVHHKAGPWSQIYSSTSRQGDSVFSKKREDLVSLHRNSCRLFETSMGESDAETRMGHHDSKPTAAGGISSTSTRKSKLHRSHSTAADIIAVRNKLTPRQTSKPFRKASQSYSPLLRSATHSPISPTFSDGPRQAVPATQHHQHWSPNVMRHSSSQDNLQSEDDLANYRPMPATVIDWTSPSTRRREYEKIDRSTRGVRGMWRKLAPSWCQSGGSRMPFFEEGKGGKGMYDGSVRRFRMDVPEDDGGSPSCRSNEKHWQAAKTKWRWNESSVSRTGSFRGGKGAGEGAGGIVHGKWRCLGITRKVNA
ncbi:hypothetical protein PAAG_07531 [Paracoccidioides lutzii Pb01]|uniref:Uncharacterized protein n=1 Tax=Paracoccidioides lutzii (strain ATCC MYA-826 / Pb01) TaxID=502779 RepID=C1H9U0_PARBA|nr:hypothetical protein PAAG_07531 [Paracoccidioides lutzii Pb01]EEH37113.2 hypothetical protein PAAG_07531 [Paracoccidioides lutzii Pb01]